MASVATVEPPTDALRVQSPTVASASTPTTKTTRRPLSYDKSVRRNALYSGSAHDPVTGLYSHAYVLAGPTGEPPGRKACSVTFWAGRAVRFTSISCQIPATKTGVGPLNWGASPSMRRLKSGAVARTPGGTTNIVTIAINNRKTKVPKTPFRYGIRAIRAPSDRNVRPHGSGVFCWTVKKTVPWYVPAEVPSGTTMLNVTLTVPESAFASIVWYVGVAVPST